MIEFPTVQEVNLLPKPEILSQEQISSILGVAPLLTKFLEDVTAYAIKQMMEQGVIIPGYKVVEGKSNRKIENPDLLAAQMIKDGYQEAAIYKSPQVETLTNLEKLVGKKEFEKKYSKYVVKPQGKPVIASLDDKRPAINYITGAIEDFAE
ncbi:MAG: DUF2800 domain-containing protein [Anaeroplasma sp.]